MTWNDFLDRMREAGFDPTEEEFMEDYGFLAGRRHAALRNRRFKCMFAVVRAEPVRFETYVFPSATDAEDFESVVGHDSGWTRRHNLVFHGLDGDPEVLEAMLGRTLDGIDSGSKPRGAIP